MGVFIIKLTGRNIRSFFGRYMAILIIVMLSVGFYAGLKITKDAMVNTCGKYLDEQNFYDYDVVSTLGFTQDEVTALEQLSFIESAEGVKSLDTMVEYDGNAKPLKLFALPEEMNLPSLTAGRMPEEDTECLADANMFSVEDIGSEIYISDNAEVEGQLVSQAYTIVGLADSPLYLSDDRGTTNIGSGRLEGFLYLSANSFIGDVYTDVYLCLNKAAPVYSQEYDELIGSHETAVLEMVESLADERYKALLAENNLTAETAGLAGISRPEVYVLTRLENAGYVSFENDSSIVSGIANIFPVFFILIAMLVCITTMTRMVDEERVQIGTLKALGLKNTTIMAKYLLYAGSATLLGWGIGFFFGTWALPQVFWYAYSSLYDFAPLEYLFRPSLALFTFLVSMAGILGSTWFSCRRELESQPATLLRPRAAKKGKRILLERITPFWKRLPFLQKITLRNMFRYKQRLIMMLVGIGCCAGLVVTAFGIRDSMINTATMQFEQVQKYDMEVTFSAGSAEVVSENLEKLEEVGEYLTCSVERVELQADETMQSVSLYTFADTERIADYWGLHTGSEVVSFPESGEAIISRKSAEKLSLATGDTMEIQDSEMRSMTVTVSGIFDNYVDNFVLISADTYHGGFGEWQANTALLTVSGDAEDLAGTLMDVEQITSVMQLSDTKEDVDSALSCLDYIIWLIVLFSGALAFIVIFNLTNINLAERSREIATVEVLGFYPKETERYVLRENLILSVLGGVLGLPLGALFHRFVMHMIQIDTMFFDIHVTFFSYLLAFICTILFAVITNLFMRRRIGKIPMAESLKAVE